MSKELGFFNFDAATSPDDLRRWFLAGAAADAPPTNRIAFFVTAITERHPSPEELTDDQIDQSPWASDFGVFPGHVNISLSHSRTPDDLYTHILDRAAAHGLAMYDADENEVAWPEDLRPPSKRPWWKFWA